MYVLVLHYGSAFVYYRGYVHLSFRGLGCLVWIRDILDTVLVEL